MKHARNQSTRGPAAARLFLALLGCASVVTGQETRGDYQRRFEDRRVEIQRAYEMFANKSLSAVDRAVALSGIGAFLVPEQIEGATKIFRDTTEPPEIRAQAIRRIPNIAADAALASEVLRILADRTAAKPLREACGDVVQGMLIAQPTIKGRLPEYLSTLRGLTEDPDPDIRERSFAILASQSDDFATQKLVEGLRSPEKALLPPARSARILATSPHGDYRGVFLDILQQPTDRATEVELIRGLSGYAPAKDALQSRGRDVTAPREVRSAALQSMLATDKSGFIQVARDVVEQDEAPDEVRVLAIDGLLVARRVPGVRYDADAVDRAVKKALESKAPALRRSAWNALKQFDPKFEDYANQLAEKEPNPELKSMFQRNLREMKNVAPTRPTRPR